MKITFLVSSLHFGGAERVATTLCNAWVQRGHQVTLIATYAGVDPCFFPLDPAIEVIYLAGTYPCTFGRSQRSFARLYKLRKILQSQTPDLVLSFLPSANIMAILAGIGLKIPVIISERTDPEFYPQPWYWKMLCKHLYQYADLLTVQTQAVAAKVPQLFNHIQRVAVVANPLPFGREQYVRQPESNTKTVVSLGRLTAGKQTEHLMTAFLAVATQYPHWCLKIFGDGPERQKLEYLAQQHPCSGQIIFCGDTKQPWVELVNADIFMMTSCFEGFPNALLEALGLGVPSIVYDCPSGPAEITEQGRLARLVPLNDEAGLTTELRSLMADESERLRLSQLASEGVHLKYSRDAVVEVWETLFRSLK